MGGAGVGGTGVGGTGVGGTNVGVGVITGGGTYSWAPISNPVPCGRIAPSMSSVGAASSPSPATPTSIAAAPTCSV